MTSKCVIQSRFAECFRLWRTLAALCCLLAASGSAQSRDDIKIHGHWKIEVWGVDGSLVSRIKFENALASVSGPKVLAQLLARQATQGYWEVDLYGGPNDVICTPYTSAHLCVISEPATSFFADSRNLSLKPDAPGATFTLAGSVAAQHDANILWVATAVHLCPTTATPATPCSEPSNQPFTTASLSPAVSVAAGQTIQVTITFGYS